MQMPNFFKALRTWLSFVTSTVSALKIVCGLVGTSQEYSSLQPSNAGIGRFLGATTLIRISFCPAISWIVILVFSNFSTLRKNSLLRGNSTRAKRNSY